MQGKSARGSPQRIAISQAWHQVCQVCREQDDGLSVRRSEPPHFSNRCAQPAVPVWLRRSRSPDTDHSRRGVDELRFRSRGQEKNNHKSRADLANKNIVDATQKRLEEDLSPK